MSRFFYDGNGQLPENVTVLSDLLNDDQRTEVNIGLEVESIGVGDRLDKIYITLATAVMGRIKAGALQKRTLASGLMAFSIDKNVRFEAGIEATKPEDNVIAHNFNDLTSLPEGVIPYSTEHTLWVAQSLLDYDFGVQQQTTIES
jgi:hypothetical protein